ncbi:MAG: DNA mismatch repair protein MutL [Bacteroidetes bacterium ADurb.Bin037]|nr:MAG: DNA mismatch repair protein MutL [Bacteroidetes bacterium ADurb.Bin037]HPW78563.1 DNA mismatch repair endonuclease MutL [Bacteroidales bacterium]HQB55774.1 DNA mismatch repair endonuclease MutL [Bacteroidales bacterium]
MIHVLPPHIASQIAAGEVIQRPASVIKELMENAVDSGADRIDVVLTDGGATLMQVTDNGCGMGPDDALLAFERHATSKIRQVDDLQNINTFGFRGEALASIASVAHVKLRTRRKEDEMGTEISIAGSAVTSQEEVVCPAGSDFSVRNLFYNVPARRRFLKSEAVELRHILEEFHRVILCHPEKTFTLTHNGNTVYYLPACDNLRTRITATLGKELNARLLDLNVDTSMVCIRGYIGHPRETYKKGGHRYFFVNGRFFKSAYLHKAVIKAYGKLIPEDRMPSYFIYLEADPGIIDVNIHPTKTEVKFQDEDVIFQMLQAVIRETLGKFALGPSIDFEIGAMQHHIPVPPAPGQHVSPPRLRYDPLFDPFRKTEEEPPAAIFEERPLQTYETPVIPLRKKYLVTPVASGLLVVHRQRALERIYYEELLPKFKDRKPVPEKLYFPVALNLQPSLAILLKQSREELLRMGFEMDEQDNVTAVPPEHPTDGPSVIASVQEILSGSYEKVPEYKYGERLSMLLAKRMAAEDHQDSRAAYQSLIDRLFTCNEPNNTPDGRRCMTIVPMEEIDKYFN